MADISAFQHKFRANGDALHHEPSNKVNKRNRWPVSCLPCRTRKLKCDKGHPCDSCTKRGDEPACSYRSDPAMARPRTSSSGSVSRAQERLHHLEGLVMQLMQSGPTSKPASSTSLTLDNGTTAEKDFKALGGLLTAEGSEPSYVGATHWAAILDNIKELKSDFGPGSSPSEEENLADGNRGTAQENSIFSLAAPPSLEAILQSMPARQTIDRRLSVYFKAKYSIIPIIHTYHFQRTYEAFWRDPHQASVLWIAALFSMLCISAQISEATGSEPPSPPEHPPPKEVFQRAAAQCLVLGRYTKPQRYAVEALCLYAQSRYQDTLDPAGEVCILVAIIVRQAFRMGYHRDPKHIPNMSVFQGEMRRRTWAMIRHFDLMNAFQVGLPSGIKPGEYDAEPPRNLVDSDFDELSTHLPPSRPETEAERMTYVVAKGRLMTVFEKILNKELSMHPVPYNRIGELDSELRQAHANVPLPLKYKPMSQSFADPAHVIMFRLNIDLLYQKSICVLHRKYLTQSTSNSYSRDACATAAMAILDHQASVHQETQPDGQLYQDRFMFSSFTFHDFFLAAMILCLDVSTNHRAECGNNADVSRKTKIEMLQRSYLICNEQKSNSKEARRVTDALAAMLAKLGASVYRPPTSADRSSANDTLPTPSSSTSSVETTSAQMNGLHMTMDPLENFMSVPENIDWAFLDQYLLDPSATGDVDPGWPDPALVGSFEADDMTGS